MIMETGDIGYGYCWCHAGRDLMTAATGLDGLCNFCRNSSPSACQRAHAKTAADNAR